MDTPSQESRQRLTLNEDLTIYHAESQKDQLFQALAGCQELELDLAQVGDVDTAGLQLLILLKQEASRQQKTVKVVAHSPGVRSVIEFCNLARFFGDPLVIPANEAA